MAKAGRRRHERRGDSDQDLECSMGGGGRVKVGVYEWKSVAFAWCGRRTDHALGFGGRGRQLCKIGLEQA